MSNRTRVYLACGVLGVLIATEARAAESAHPVVAGFERFPAAEKADAVAAGSLLLGELNCTSCHQAEPGLDAWIARKQAPVLDSVGGRVRPEFLRAFLTDPHGVQPGTTMPDLLAGLSRAEKRETVEALVHFLASTGGLSETKLDRKLIPNGKKLYSQSGCLACHGRRDGKSAPLATSVPLPDLAAKYTVSSLAAFLQDPHKSRPSGRMPSLNLKPQEAQELAAYLLQDLQVSLRPNLAYRYYEGNWSNLPDFTKLTPKEEGKSEGFDVTPALRNDNMAFRFEGHLHLERAGEYRFHVRSDDGGRLWIDDRLVVDNDGIHAPTEKAGAVTLTKGTHRLVAAVFNGGGGCELDVEIEGPGLGRQPVSGFLSLFPEPEKAAEATNGPARFTADPSLAKQGRELFARIGCASCHSLHEGDKALVSELHARPLVALVPSKGCLATSPARDRPDYALNAPQRQALAVALRAVRDLASKKPSPRQTIARILTTFNCYACHQRDGVGGVEEARDAYFETTQKEMGDEGRIPPHLTGVGAKLAPTYLEQIFANGAEDRPYMLTRMPRFGAGNLEGLPASFRAVDPIEPVAVPLFDETPRRVKVKGRFLTGSEAFGCIKCHTFKGVQAEGVQAIDMARMTRRLNHDWFSRYVVDPPKFRPGTRMPTAWPDGKSLLKVFEANTARQVEAIWQFLSDGAQAAEPYGLGREPLPLVAEKEALIYRNFIEGAGPRAIGVGYPEKANLAFDAHDMRLALIWQGAFIDAARHWNGRGEGFQPPLGDNVVDLPRGAPFARLPSPTHPWPVGPSKTLGYRFRGYRLGPDQRPTFLYEFGPVHVEDLPEAVAARGKDGAPGLKRTLSLTSDGPADNLWFRAVVADKIEPRPGGWFLVNGEWKVRVDSSAPAVVRAANGKSELLAPVGFHEKQARVVEQFEW